VQRRNGYAILSIRPPRGPFLEMRSHSVPRKLLEQFSYPNKATGAPGLWKYEKGLAPSPRASPRSATRFEGYFKHPTKPDKEEELEERLARQFEDPVNLYLADIGGPDFSFNDSVRRQLTQYLTLLWIRSQARRFALVHFHEVTVRAVNRFLANENRVLTVATKWNLDLFFSGRHPGLYWTPARIRESVTKLITSFDSEEHRQARYVDSVERMMSSLDDAIFTGEWRILRASKEHPFIISDTPAVTLERTESGEINYGLGFHRTDVEVFLPVSSTVCLHVLPSVRRTRMTKEPTTDEVNITQAAFAYSRCYASIESEKIERDFQFNVGRAKLGLTAFSVWGRDYNELIYSVLLNGVTPLAGISS